MFTHLGKKRKDDLVLQLTEISCAFDSSIPFPTVIGLYSWVIWSTGSWGYQKFILEHSKGKETWKTPKVTLWIRYWRPALQTTAANNSNFPGAKSMGNMAKKMNWETFLWLFYGHKKPWGIKRPQRDSLIFPAAETFCLACFGTWARRPLVRVPVACSWPLYLLAPLSALENMDGPCSSRASGTVPSSFPAMFLDCTGSSWLRVRPNAQMRQLWAWDARPGMGGRLPGAMVYPQENRVWKSLRFQLLAEVRCHWFLHMVLKYLCQCLKDLYRKCCSPN